MSAGAIIFWIVIATVVAAVAVAGYYAMLTRRIARQAEALVPPCGRFATVDGQAIHYVDTEKGRPILFVHGLGGMLTNFSWPLFDRLEGDFRLVALDRPGSGYSRRVGDRPASPTEQADFIARFIDALGLEKPLVVGHSLGGAISLALALKFPDRISGLALIAPLTHHLQETPPEFRALYLPWRPLRRLVACTVAVPNTVKYRERTLAFIFGPQSPPEAYAVEGGAMAALRPSHFLATSTDFVAIGEEMKGLETRYGEIAMPTGILFGSHDRVVDCATQGKAMEGRIEGLDLDIVDGIGHMPQYAEPERVAAFIRRMAARAFAA